MNICIREDCNNQVKRRESKYCSLSCANSVNSKRPRVDRTRQCKNCGESFQRGESVQQFCSKSCSAKFNNLGRGTKKQKTLKRSLVQKWLDGDFDGSCASGLSVCIRRYLIEQANYKCESINCCVPGGWSGFNPVTNKSCLTVDHIDGNSQNNSRENLIILCPNCHSMTPTYGALNKGNGRKSRYQS